MKGIIQNDLDDNDTVSEIQYNLFMSLLWNIKRVKFRQPTNSYAVPCYISSTDRINVANFESNIKFGVSKSVIWNRVLVLCNKSL